LAGCSSGWGICCRINFKKIKKDVHAEWYYGKHEINEDGDVQAVFIQREEREENDEADSSTHEV